MILEQVHVGGLVHNRTRVRVAGLYQCIAQRVDSRAVYLRLASVCILGVPACTFSYGLRDACLPAAPGHSGDRFIITASAIIPSDLEVLLSSWQNPSVGARKVTCCGFIRLPSRPNLVGWKRSSVFPSKC